MVGGSNDEDDGPAFAMIGGPEDGHDDAGLSGNDGDEPDVTISHRPEKKKRHKERDIEDEEALALRLLGQ